MCECNKLSQWMSYRISCMTITFYLIICLYKDRHRVNLVKKELDVYYNTKIYYLNLTYHVPMLPVLHELPVLYSLISSKGKHSSRINI